MYATFASSCYSISTAKLVSRRRASCGKRPFAADELTPASFWNWINASQGLLLRSGGTTSHTVILARSFNIPTLVGVDLAALLPWVDTQVQIDGNAGLLVVDPSPAVARYYQQEAATGANPATAAGMAG